jgi:hypothetical protein
MFVQWFFTWSFTGLVYLQPGAPPHRHVLRMPCFFAWCARIADLDLSGPWPQPSMEQKLPELEDAMAGGGGMRAGVRSSSR